MCDREQHLTSSILCLYLSPLNSSVLLFNLLFTVYFENGKISSSSAKYVYVGLRVLLLNYIPESQVKYINTSTYMLKLVIS